MNKTNNSILLFFTLIFVFSSCDNDSRLLSENTISQEAIESSEEFKQFAYYYTDFLLHAQLAKSDILSDKYQNFRDDMESLSKDDFPTAEERLKISSLYGFPSAEAYQKQNEAFTNAFYALGEKFTGIFSSKNHDLLRTLMTNYLKNIDISHQGDSLNKRNDEPEFILRLELSQCRFPQTISQEGPGEFACDGWESNNCQEYWNDCVAREQIEYILSSVRACGLGSIWTQWGTIFQNPPQNSNGVGGYNGLSLLLLTEGTICNSGNVFNPIFYSLAVCNECVVETQRNCCD